MREGQAPLLNAHERKTLRRMVEFFSRYGVEVDFKGSDGLASAMIDVAKTCRGEVSTNELVAFLYASSFPREQWSDRVDEARTRMLTEPRHHE